MFAVTRTKTTTGHGSPWLVAVTTACMALVASVTRGGPVAEAGLGTVKLTPAPDRVLVTIGGEPFTEYLFDGPDRGKPVLAPMLGPGGVRFNRSWPLGPDVPGEPHDHPHHECMWFAHGDVNGHDFWQGKDGARIVHAGFERIAGDTIVTRCRWLAGDGSEVCSDVRTITFGGSDRERTVDVAIAITASAGPVVFGDTKEGTMAFRVRPELTLPRADHAAATGHYLNSAGERDAAVWGKPASWVHLQGQVEGRTVGVACFDHPTNHRHPTTWHARDYGLFAANPFGLHDFTGAPAGSGRLELEPGKSLGLRYRWVFHEGDVVAAGIEARFAAWAAAAAER